MLDPIEPDKNARPNAFVRGDALEVGRVRYGREVDNLLDHGKVEVTFRREVMAEQATTDAGRAGQLGRGDVVEVARTEQLGGGLEDLSAPRVIRQADADTVRFGHDP